MDSLQTQFNDHKKLLDSIHSNTQTHFANQTQVNNSLLEVQKTQTAQLAKQIPDPYLAYQRDKLLQDVQRENCVLKVLSSTSDSDSQDGGKY